MSEVLSEYEESTFDFSADYVKRVWRFMFSLLETHGPLEFVKLKFYTKNKFGSSFPSSSGVTLDDIFENIPTLGFMNAFSPSASSKTWCDWDIIVVPSNCHRPVVSEPMPDNMVEAVAQIKLILKLVKEEPSLIELPYAWLQKAVESDGNVVVSERDWVREISSWDSAEEYLTLLEEFNTLKNSPLK